MPKLKPSDREIQSRERRAILAAGQARDAASDEVVAKSMGVVLRTYQRRKTTPGELSLDEVCGIIKRLHLTDQEVLVLVKGCR